MFRKMVEQDETGTLSDYYNTASVFLHHRGAAMQTEASITITIYNPTIR